MLTITRILGLTLLIAGLLADPRLREAHAFFIDAPAAVFIVFGMFTYVLIRCESTEWFAVVRAMFKQKPANELETLRSALSWLVAASRGAMVSGLVGWLINAIAVLANGGMRPDSYLNGMAVSLLYILYAVVLSQFFFSPFAAGLSKRLNAACDETMRTR